MQAVILTAGNGTRMGDLTKEIPKPLLTIEGKTLLEYKMDILPADCTEIIMMIWYLGDTIRNYFGDNYKGTKITYVEAKTLGTGYTLWQAKEDLHGPFIVMCGDDLYARKDIEECAKYPLASLVHRSEKPVSGGKVVLDENQEYIQDIVEGSHGEGTIVATGLYSLTPEIFSVPLVKANNGKDEYGLPQTLMQFKAKGMRAVFATAWHQATGPKDLLLSSEEVKPFL